MLEMRYRGHTINEDLTITWYDGLWSNVGATSLAMAMFAIDEYEASQGRGYWVDWVGALAC